jgi:transcriptional regulator with XRE-family HTH domain
MTLSEYFVTRPHGSHVELARKLGISKTWMSLIVRNRKIPSVHLSKLIELYTDGVVTINDLCSSRLNK